MKITPVFCLAVFAIAFSGSQLYAEVHKMIARPVVVVDEYEYQGNATLCKGIAVDAGNGYLNLFTKQDEREYCSENLKKRLMFPANRCSLHHMVDQCVDQIEATKHIKSIPLVKKK
jgi:hypothetical protein